MREEEEEEEEEEEVNADDARRDEMKQEEEEDGSQAHNSAGAHRRSSLPRTPAFARPHRHRPVEEMEEDSPMHMVPHEEEEDSNDVIEIDSE
jgi:hypothetical protein